MWLYMAIRLQKFIFLDYFILMFFKLVKEITFFYISRRL